jgi:hypothetical protein
MLGYIRGKYSSIPIPNSEVTLNSADLLSAAQSEKTALLEQLRAFLAEVTKEKMLARQQAENASINEVLSKIPLKIYVG